MVHISFCSLGLGLSIVSFNRLTRKGHLYGPALNSVDIWKSEHELCHFGTYEDGSSHLAALQKLLGHKEITMTMRYAHIIEDDLLEEVEAMSGMVNANLLPTHGQIVSSQPALNS